MVVGWLPGLYLVVGWQVDGWWLVGTLMVEKCCRNSGG